MLEIPKHFHRTVFHGSLILCAFSLPLSVFLLTLSQIVLLINWVIEENLYARWQKIKQCKPLWFFILFYCIHLAGLLNTSDFSYAVHDLRIKLPYLILPLIIATSVPINTKWLRNILLGFLLGILLSSIYTTYNIYISEGDIMAQMRIISPLVWHIRLAIMSVFAIVSIPWLLIPEKTVTWRILYLMLFAWFLAFLFILQSLTGIVILILIGLVLTSIKIIKTQNLIIKWFLVTLVCAFILITSSWLVHYYSNNFSPKPINISMLDTYTSSGNPYSHIIDPPYIENGNFVNLYICNVELEKEWSKRSAIHIDSCDIYNGVIRQTLIRYLTGKGLRKDSAGVSQLTAEEIKHIENGVANPLFAKKTGFTSRIYRLMWELYHYSRGANPSGYSVAQRIEYLKTAVHITRRNFWLGTGTGDVLKEFLYQYETDRSKLAPYWRLRAHNQLLTFLLTFGVFGFMAIVATIFIPPVLTKKYKNYLFNVFFLIFILSMLNEDTLETHAGISFIALFYGILLFATDTSEEKIPD